MTSKKSAPFNIDDVYACKKFLKDVSRKRDSELTAEDLVLMEEIEKKKMFPPPMNSGWTGGPKKAVAPVPLVPPEYNDAECEEIDLTDDAYSSRPEQPTLREVPIEQPVNAQWNIGDIRRFVSNDKSTNEEKKTEALKPIPPVDTLFPATPSTSKKKTVTFESVRAEKPSTVPLLEPATQQEEIKTKENPPLKRKMDELPPLKRKMDELPPLVSTTVSKTASPANPMLVTDQYADGHRAALGPLKIRREIIGFIKKQWMSPEEEVDSDILRWFRGGMTELVYAWNFTEMIRADDESVEFDPVAFLMEQHELRVQFPNNGIPDECKMQVDAVVRRERSKFSACKEAHEVFNVAKDLIVGACGPSQTLGQLKDPPKWMALSPCNLTKLFCEALQIDAVKGFHRAFSSDGKLNWFHEEVHSAYMANLLRRDTPFRPPNDNPIRLLCAHCYKDEVTTGLFSTSTLQVYHTGCIAKRMMNYDEQVMTAGFMYFKAENPRIL